MFKQSRRSSNRRSGNYLHQREPGQAIVIIALVMVVLIGFTALAIDGGGLYLLQRDAQNAADASIMAALFAKCAGKSDPDIAAAARAAASQNGFDNDGTQDTVAVNIPPTTGPKSAAESPSHTGDPEYVEIIITANKPAQLIQLLYNGPLQVSVRVTGHCEPGFDWASASAMTGIGNCPGERIVDFTGSGATISVVPPATSAVVSNGDTNIQNGTINGNVSSTGTISGNATTTGTTTSPAPVVTAPILWKIADFQPGGDIATKAGSYYHSYSGNLDDWTDFGVGDPPPNGIYYVAGSITLGSNDWSAWSSGTYNITLVATGKISITFPNPPPDISIGPFDLLTVLTAPDNENPRYAVMPFAFTSYGNISGPTNCASNDLNDQAMSFGGKASWFGALYAPNGYVQMSFSSGGSLDGAVIAQKVSVSGSSFTIIYNPAWIPSIPPEISVTQ